MPSPRTSTACPSRCGRSAAESSRSSPPARRPGPHVPTAVIHAVAERKRPVVTDDIKTHPELHGHDCGRASGFARCRSSFAARPCGVLAFCTSQPLSDAVSVLATVADLLALGIARARVEEERHDPLRARAEHARRGRGREPEQGRVPRDGLARAAHAAERHHRLDRHAARRRPRRRLERSAPLETIERSARSQAQLIDDLLDVSRIVSGKLRVNVGSVDVPSVADMALESVRLAADSKGVTLDAFVDPAAGQLTGDADRIQQIIWNLLSNAIKFTPKGGRVAASSDARGARHRDRGRATPGRGSPPNSCRTSSSASSRPTAR